MSDLATTLAGVLAVLAVALVSIVVQGLVMPTALDLTGLSGTGDSGDR